jgi:hypothetical protein
MQDVRIAALTAGFALLTWGLIWVCDRLLGDQR